MGAPGVEETAVTTSEDERTGGPEARLGFEPGQVVQEIGLGDDVDEELRAGIARVIGQELVGEDYDDVVDVVLLWFREEDGDLTDGLVDCIALLEEGGVIWLLTPKVGLDGHVEPSDIAEAVTTAGLSQARPVSVTKRWAGARLTTPKSRR
ncbi:DUF3052 domain-containing protein [Streptomyces sp. NPDC055005]